MSNLNYEQALKALDEGKLVSRKVWGKKFLSKSLTGEDKGIKMNDGKDKKDFKVNPYLKNEVDFYIVEAPKKEEKKPEQTAEKPATENKPK